MDKGIYQLPFQLNNPRQLPVSLRSQDVHQYLSPKTAFLGLRVVCFANFTRQVMPFALILLGSLAALHLGGRICQAAGSEDLQTAVALLQKKYSQVRDLKMDFIQNHRNPRRGQRSESGLLYLRRPGMMRWEYRQPSDKLFVSDGKTLSFYIPEDRQVQRGKVKESRDQRVPFLFLLGKGDLRKDFARLEWATEEKPFFAGNRAFMAYPKKGGEEFSKVLMEYDPASIQLQRIIIFSLDGSRSEFIFTKIHENSGVNVSLFNFKIPAGVEVVGLEEN